ncbi:MAG: NADH-quinone oxidoreductase subunit J [Candidatus Bathyarchaeota archaeon]|nr:NADH-quinone oxidoreductase subunit J [Candidatus Bathyarchaeota archaeon]
MIEILLIGTVVVLAVLAVELEKLLHSVVCLGGMCVVIGVLFGLLNASYVMVFQLLVYAGATMVLFLAVVMLTERHEE